MNRVNVKNKNDIKKKAKKFSTGKFILTIIFLIIIISGVRFGIAVYENGGGVQGFLSAILGQTPETLEELETLYVLVLGVSEDIDKKLTDTIILCAYNPKNQSASMISIPRDTFIGKNSTKAKGSDKINSVYSSSPEKTIKAVKDITGIDIDYYAVINTDALIKIVDIIGGVNFEVPIDMDYDDPTQNLHIHLKKGMQNINGEEAEQLLRYRHSNPDENGHMKTYPAEYGADDYGRMRTQREFITETVKQTLKFKNITKFKSLLDTVFENIETNLNIDLILPYMPYAAAFDTSSIESNQLPGISEKYNNIWFFVHDEEKTTELVKNMINNLEGHNESDSLKENTNTSLNIISKENTTKK